MRIPSPTCVHRARSERDSPAVRVSDVEIRLPSPFRERPGQRGPLESFCPPSRKQVEIVRLFSVPQRRLAMLRAVACEPTDWLDARSAVVSPTMKRDTGLPSGRFLLRIDPPLHAALRRAAQEAGISLNDYCGRSLAAPPGRAGALRPAADVVRRAASLFGEHLVGVLVYGSFARGDAEASSDVDVLIVVDRSVRLTRALYRQWDETPVTWEGRSLDPHFAHCSEPGEPPSSLWAELALDGIVLFERELALSRALVRIRRDILDRRLVRHVVHGQPYWAAAS